MQDEAAVKRGHLAMFEAFQVRRKDPNKGLKQALKAYPVGRNLYVEKLRLYDLLISYVKELNLSRNKVSPQRKRLEEAEVLFDMGLWNEAAEATLKGIAKAEELEDLHMEVLLRDLLRKIYKNMVQRDMVDAATQNEYSLVMASKKLATLMRYSQLNDRMFAYTRNYRGSDSDAIKRGMDELMASAEMKDINKADSLPSQIRYYTVLSQYHRQQNNENQAIEAEYRLLALWEQIPERIATDPAEYRAVINNLMGALSTLGRFDEAEVLLRKLEAIPVSGGKSELLQFNAIELQHILFYLNQGKIAKAAEREPQILEGLKRFQKRMPNSVHLSLLYNLGVTHLLLDNSGKAIQYFDRIRNLGRLPQRQDLQGVARLLRLLLMTEKRTELNFEHYLRNSQRFFGSKDRGYNLEEKVHDWLQRYEKAKVDEEKPMLREFVEMMEPMVQNRVTGSEEMLLWATARLTGKTTEKVFLERLGKA